MTNSMSDVRPIPAVQFSQREIEVLCRKHGIRRLSIFGSALRDDFGPESDVDVLVEFLPGRTPGFGFVTIEDELSTLIGREVDLHTPASLSRYFRDEVLEEARELYVAA
jgi:hypothetical protein